MWDKVNAFHKYAVNLMDFDHFRGNLKLLLSPSTRAFNDLSDKFFFTGILIINSSFEARKSSTR